MGAASVGAGVWDRNRCVVEKEGVSGRWGEEDGEGWKGGVGREECGIGMGVGCGRVWNLSLFLS